MTANLGDPAHADMPARPAGGDGAHRSRFRHGVSAFMVDATTVRIATITSVDGGARDPEVAWTVVADDVPLATGAAQPDEHGCVVAEVEDLPADAELRYWFHVGDDRSARGRVRTRPPGAPLRIALASCVRSVDARPAALRDVARLRPDLMLHVGDYIYEDGQGGERSAHHPPRQCRSADDYRMRLSQYRADAELQAAHAVMPWITVWDDHDVADDLWRRGSPALGPDETRRRRSAGLAARRTFLPEPRGDGPGPFDRSVRFPGVADIVVIDARHARRPPAGSGPTRVAAESDRDGMLSQDQWRWLHDVIGRSAEPWLLLVSSVQFSPMRLAMLPSTRGRVPLVNPGQWDGYPASRRRLLSIVDEHLSGTGRGAMVLSGDLHGRFIVSNRQPDTLCEITTPAVSAPPFADLVRRRVRVPVPTRLLEWWIGRLNRHFSTVELGRNGATFIDVDTERVRVADERGRTLAWIDRAAAAG